MVLPEAEWTFFLATTHNDGRKEESLTSLENGRCKGKQSSGSGSGGGGNGG